MSGPRNKLSDLNNHLFEQLERLNDDELIGEELEEEINRSKAVMSVAATIIKNGNLVLRAHEMYRMDENKKLPEMLEERRNEEV